jgi:hypothetical protein
MLTFPKYFNRTTNPHLFLFVFHYLVVEVMVVLIVSLKLVFMKSRILLFFLCLITAFQIDAQTSPKKNKNFFPAIKHDTRTSGEFTYTLTVLSEPYVELTGAISVNNGEAWDDPEYFVPIGFPFELNGNTITALQFYGVGSLLISNVSNPDILAAVFPYENDLIDRGYINDISESPISYKVEGTAPNRIFKLEISNAGSYYEYEEFGTSDMFFNHQLWLYEGSNQIEFRYGPASIDDPGTWYADGGAYVGLTDVDLNTDEFINPHFIAGDASAPFLSINDITLEGTPGEDVVYRLSLPAPLEVTVTGVNSTSSCNPNGSATAQATGGTEPYSYEWSNGETTQTITNLDAGTYTVTVTDALFAAATGTVTITSINPVNPNAFATDETGVDANDGTATSAAIGGIAPYDYEWSNGESTQTIINLSPGAYTVTVTDSEGCTGTETVIVNAFECANLEIVVLQFDASCNGICDGWISNVGVEGATPPFTYIWSNGLATADALNLCAGDYFLTVIDANGCVITGGPYTISEPAILLANASSTNETSIDANDGTARVDPTGGTLPYTTLWSNGSPDPVQTNLAPGLYGVTVTDSHGCIDSQQVEILEFNCTVFYNPFHIDQSCYFFCDGEAGVEVTGGVGPFTYQWNTGETEYFLSNLCAGTYNIVVTDVGTGCTGSEVFEILAPDTNEVTIDFVLHYNNLTAGAISITASGGTPPYNYAWVGPNGYTSNEEDISGLAPGLYNVVVIDFNGCAIESGFIEILDQTVSTGHLPYIEARIYPNPASDQVFIDIDQIEGFNIRLVSMDGRLMKSWEAERILNIGDISPGIYLLEGVSAEAIFRKQLSIQK